MRSLFFALLAFVFAGFAAQSQDLTEVPDSDAKDTLDFKLRFYKGDTLIYRSTAYDSIVIEYGRPLMKSRFERYRVVCDSVGENGRFFLSQEMIDFKSIETHADKRNVERESSAWLGRKVFLEIDSVGKRYSLAADDPMKAAMSPGTAFQPTIFFNFDKSKSAVDASWIGEDIVEDYPENGIPAPVIRSSYLYRLIGEVDTLDCDCARVEYIRTGAGNAGIVTKELEMKTTCVINGYGLVDISTTEHIPWRRYETLELKLTIDLGEETKQGRHFITTEYIIEDLIRSIPDNGEK